MVLHGNQIAQSMSRAPDNATNHPQAALYQIIPYQSYQLGQSQCIYQYTVEKKVYQVDEKDFENRSQNFYTIFDLVGKGVNYFDKGFKELIANFVEIETFCSRCNSSSPLKSQLHKHLKAGYTRTV